MAISTDKLLMYAYNSVGVSTNEDHWDPDVHSQVMMRDMAREILDLRERIANLEKATGDHSSV